ncbi:protein phosphatase inhibitor 2-like [Mytilus californianus]|uniref:protein phosphatase inhibitor 2-like n=1 Tax=Mytilus californianus TaxID=6549 RepID=UPI002245071F|nr:protein phosphatase inhibitor 2-like [Mytilus californianus]
MIQAGRRSETGAGTFILVHEDSSEISKAIDKLTKRRVSEQLTSKLGFSQSEKIKPLSNRISKPIPRREHSPPPTKEISSLNDNSDIKAPLSRHQYPHVSSEFKRELEDVISGKIRLISEQSSKSRIKIQETKDEKDEENEKELGAVSKSKDKKPNDKSEQEVYKEDNDQDENNMYDELELPLDCNRFIEPHFEKADQRGDLTQKPASLSDEKPEEPDEPSIYAEAQPPRQEAWKSYGAQDEEHLENYELIKIGASQNALCKSFDSTTNDEEEIDDTYDHAFLAEKNLKKENITTDSKNIYGISSGKEILEEETDGDPEYEFIENYDCLYSKQKCIPQAEAFEDADIRL